MSIPRDGFFYLHDIAGSSSANVYMLGQTHQNASATITHHFFHWQSGTWSLVQSVIGGIFSAWGYSTIWVSSEGTVYTAGDGVFRLDGSSWINVLQSQSNFSYIGGISDESIFVAGTLGEVWHYNGKEVFIVGYDLPYSAVFHAAWIRRLDLL